MSYENAPATKMLATHCACCARPLVDAASVEAGIGPECRKRHGYSASQKDANWDDVMFALDGIVPVAEINPSVEPRIASNLLVHRIAAQLGAGNLAGEDVLDMVRAIDALGFSKLSERILDRIEPIRLIADGNALLVFTPFSEAFVAGLKSKIAAKADRRWDPAKKAWRVSMTQKRVLWTLLQSEFAGRVAIGPKGAFTIGGAS
jgi:hypothetical protein